MTDPSLDGPSVQSPFDVERVEWVPATRDALEVRICGRWRADVSERVELLVADGDPAHPWRRFPAVASSVDEAGSWRGSFAVPVELRPRLSSRLALRAGAQELSLPAASPGPADEQSAPPPATVVEPAVLAQRRAAREGQADEALVRRAHAAEATASTLETQLDHLEARLHEALAERDRAAARLRAAEQRAEAERRVRAEAQAERDTLRGEVERRTAELRARARAAEEHAQALGAEMDAIRREAAEAQQAAAAARVAAERAARGVGEQAQAELDRLGAEAAALSRRLEAERDARAAAERALARQAERVAEVEATVALLDQELDRRTTVQSRVQAELETLRQALAQVRSQTDERGTRDGAALRSLEELQATAAGLRGRIASLEATERAARAELREAQGELAVRTRELERSRTELERSRAELSAAHAAQEAAGSALHEAERTVGVVRHEATELQARLEEERRRRFAAEASLAVELERQRERFGEQVAAVEAEVGARIAAERTAFQEQAAAIETLVGSLRSRLADAGAQLESRLAANERLRDEALAERDAALGDVARVKRELAADLERAAAERDELLAELAARDEELAALRASSGDTTARDATIRALVADVLATAGALRDGFDRQLAELSERVEAEVAALRSQLDDERTARIVAEEELAAERARGAAPVGGSLVADVLARNELEHTRRELAAAQELLAAERDRSAEASALRDHAGQLVRDLEAAEARLKVREADDAGVEATAEAPALDEDERAAAPDVEASVAAAAPDVDAPAAGAAADVEASEAADAPAAAVDAPVAVAAPDPAAPANPAAELPGPPPGAAALTPRFVRPADRPLTGWLTPAITALAQRDEALAAELIVELLPGQVGLVRDPIRYALTIEGSRTYGVRVDRDRVEVEPDIGPDDGGIDVHVAGPPAALVPLVAGGARRKLSGVQIKGRKRRLRRLLRARRQPIDLARLADRGVQPSPELVLAVLAAAVEPSWTAGHRFAVVYALAGADAGAIEVRAQDGQPLTVQPAAAADRAEPPAARISVRGEAVLPLLTRTHLAPGERVYVTGDRHVVALLHGWFDRAQGLPGG